MSAESWAVVAGGAGREQTQRDNETAFRRWTIRPRMLRDVSTRDLSIELFGRRLRSPLLLAPVGQQEVAHREADLATARACASEQVPMVISSQASFPMERIAAAIGDTPHWFQLYWSKSDALVASFVRRAEACGCSAIVVTADTPLLGWRGRDLDLAYLTFALGMGIAQYTSDAEFAKLLKTFVPRPGPGIGLLFEGLRRQPLKLLRLLASPRRRAAAGLFLDTYSNPAVTWSRLPFLRELTKLPILVKGITHAADARLAIESGVDGIIVSNHGGRQVDGAIAALDALQQIVAEVDETLPVLFDSGIRSGADIFKALALGAKAALIGRPFVYGLAIDGEAGVRAVIANLLAELDLTMGLCGCSNVSDIGRDSVTQIP